MEKLHLLLDVIDEFMVDVTDVACKLYDEVVLISKSC